MLHVTLNFFSPVGVRTVAQGSDLVSLVVICMITQVLNHVCVLSATDLQVQQARDLHPGSVHRNECKKRA